MAPARRTLTQTLVASLIVASGAVVLAGAFGVVVSSLAAYWRTKSLKQTTSGETPVTMPPETPDRTQFKIATIAALAAIVAGAIGALAGGLATYWGNKSLQTASTRDVARGIARVYQGEFVDFDARLSAMLSTNRLIAPDHNPFQLSTDDKKELASVMSAQDWYRVESAEAGLRTFDDPGDVDMKRAAAGISVSLTPARRTYIRSNLTAAQQAIVALAEAAGQPRDHPLGD